MNFYENLQNFHSFKNQQNYQIFCILQKIDHYIHYTLKILKNTNKIHYTMSKGTP